MMKTIITRYRKSSLLWQASASVVSFVLYGMSSAMLEASYAASKFPVPYYVGQTSFDAAKVKSWYQVMLNAGTMETYRNTQLIDFIFIASVIAGGFFIWTLLASLHTNAFFKSWGYRAAFLLPLAGLFDVFENIVSFFMIADPIHFPDGIVIVYSAFAVIKFVFWSLALSWLMISILALLITKALGRRLVRQGH